MKAKRSKMKNTLNEINSKLHIAEEKITVFEDTAEETSMKHEKRIFKNKQEM